LESGGGAVWLQHFPLYCSRLLTPGHPSDKHQPEPGKITLVTGVLRARRAERRPAPTWAVARGCRPGGPVRRASKV
jgi:hypothetical protein